MGLDNAAQMLHFERTTTPRGNEVAHLDRLERDGSAVDQERLMEFFRLVRARL